MKLTEFSVSNFRSITEKVTIEIMDYTVIIGKNNIGKSNVLNALTLALDLVKTAKYIKTSRSPRGRSVGYLHDSRNQYVRERDFPIGVKKPEKKHTIFKLSFKLVETEREELKSKYDLNINSLLTLKFDFSAENGTYDVIMHGKASQKFNENKHHIATFIAEKLKPIYIPCIRSTEDTERAFGEAYTKLLHQLDSDREYQCAMEIIQKKEQEIRNSLENKVKNQLASYMPSVTSLTYESEGIRQIHRYGTIFIDDGEKTELDLKGDGIKSLCAISLFQYNTTTAQNNVLCIEEPESHLHSEAIYGIRKILMDTANNAQVVITTHSPLLVNKEKIECNYIVEKGSIKKCKNILEIKETLGIRISDELAEQELVVLVEGESDKRILGKVLTAHIDFEKLCNAKKIKIVNMHGATKASNLAIFYTSLLISIHVLLDNDAGGINERKKLINSGVITYKDITSISCVDMQKSELEDTVIVDLYNQYVIDAFHVDLKNDTLFKKKNDEWSTRVKNVFNAAGQPYNQDIEDNIKTKIADIVVEKGETAFYPQRKGWIESIVLGIKEKLCL